MLTWVQTNQPGNDADQAAIADAQAQAAQAALDAAQAQASVEAVTQSTDTKIAGFNATLADILARLLSLESNIPTTMFKVNTSAFNTMDAQTDNSIAPITLTISAPAAFAGTYTIQPGDLASGPVNIIPPSIIGTPKIDHELVGDPGLWCWDADQGAPIFSGKWDTSGPDAPVVDGEVLTTLWAQGGRSVTYAVTASQGDKYRTATTAPVAIAAPTPVGVVDTYDGLANGTLLHGLITSTGTYTQLDGSGGAQIQSGRIKPTSGYPVRRYTHSKTLAGDQFAEADIRRGSNTADTAPSTGIGVRLSANSGYFFSYHQGNNVWRLWSGGTTPVQLGEDVPNSGLGLDAVGSIVRIRLEAAGSTIRGIVNGIPVIEATDGGATAGLAGMRMHGSQSLGVNAEIDNFGSGDLYP